MNFRDNTMTMVQKLEETLVKNHRAKIVDLHDGASADYVEFYISEWSSGQMNSIFAYCGVECREWLMEWQVVCHSQKNLRVVLWIKHPPKDCPHSFVYRDGWGSDVCQLCGVMKPKKNKTEDNENRIGDGGV